MLQYPSVVTEEGEKPLPTPTFVFALIIATLLGAVAHLIVGGSGRRLLTLLLAGWIGFAIGHVLGVAFRIDTFIIGTLRLFPALIGGCLLLVAAVLLTGGGKPKRIAG